MNFDPLVYVDKSGDKIFICGAEYKRDSEGRGDYMVAQIYITDHDFPENDTLVDKVGDRWRLTHAVERGFKMTGIVLERVENV